MRFSAAVSTTVLAGALLFPQVARADLYTDYLRDLGAYAQSTLTFGYTPEELQQAEARARMRPEFPSGTGYEAFAAMLGSAINPMLTFGVDAAELRMINALLSAAPHPMTPLTPQGYIAMLSAARSLANSMSSFGFTAEEVQVVQLVTRAIPANNHPPPMYEQTWRAWNADVTALEQSFNTFGIDAAETQVLEAFRAVRPQLPRGMAIAVPVAPGQPVAPAQPAVPVQPVMPVQPVAPGYPMVPPVYPPVPPQPPAVDPSIAAPIRGRHPVQVCGRNATVEQEVRYAVQGAASRRLLLMADTRELVEVDESNCQQRWLADGITDYLVFPATGSIAMVRTNGELFVAQGTGPVFRAAQSVQTIAPLGVGNDDGWGPGGGRGGARTAMQLIDRAGGAHRLSVRGGAQAGANGGLALRFDGQPASALLRYQSVWGALQF